MKLFTAFIETADRWGFHVQQGGSIFERCWLDFNGNMDFNVAMQRLVAGSKYSLSIPYVSIWNDQISTAETLVSVLHKELGSLSRMGEVAVSGSCSVGKQSIKRLAGVPDLKVLDHACGYSLFSSLPPSLMISPNSTLVLRPVTMLLQHNPSSAVPSVAVPQPLSFWFSSVCALGLCFLFFMADLVNLCCQI